MQNQFSKNNRESFDRTNQLEIDRKLRNYIKISVELIEIYL